MGTPWESAPDLWPTEKAYCQWLRSQTRRVWARHPIKHRVVKASKVPVANIREEDRPAKLNPRTKELCRCAMCSNFVPPSQVEVDHKEMAGSFNTIQEWHEWSERLLIVGDDDLRVLCKSCHKKVNLSQRFHCDIAEAEIRQKLAAFKKLRIAGMRRQLVGLSLIVGNETKKQCEEVYEQWLRNTTSAGSTLPPALGG